MEKIFASLVMLLVVMLLIGCDAALNPFDSVSDGLGEIVGELGQTSGFFTVPYSDDDLKTPMELMQVTNMAPAVASTQVNIESDLFVNDGDPYGVKVYKFAGISELNAKEFMVYTGRIGYIRAWYEGGGDVLNLYFNKIPLKYYKNNAFVLSFKLDGTIHQVQDGNDAIQNIEFRMSTNLPQDTEVWLWSEALGGAAVRMTRIASQTWTTTTCYYDNKPFEFTLWSGSQNILTDGVSVNSTMANYLIEKDPGDKLHYPKYHFKGYVKDGKFYNSGTANIKIAVRN